jgi:elongation factor G
MFVINKLDRDRADFQMAFDSLSVLGVKTVVLQVPIRRGDAFVGVVDVLKGKALMFADGGVAEAEIPSDLADDVRLLHDVTVENIAESDEILMEKYLEEGSLGLDDLDAGLRAGVISGELTPVLVCSAIENKGARAVLDAVEALLPSPFDRPAFTDFDGNERVASPDGSPACFVFKTLSDPFSGQLSLLRVLSGTVSTDTVLKNMRAEENERLGNLLYLTGKTQTPVKDSIYPGAIVAVAKLKNTRSGDTLCDEKAPFALPMPKLPPQLITYALAPREKGEEDKVYTAIQRLLDEDITLKLARDEENADILLSGMGQLHIELSVEKAKRRYKIDIVLKTPKVPYRETVRGKCQVQGRHKKQSGGRGQFGDCWIEMEGLPRGAGYVFEDAIVGGVIPRQYIPAIDKGIQEAAARGFLAGCQVVDYRVKVYDGSYHTVDSSEMAFKVAGSLAFKKAMENLKPVLLEPVVLLTISIPDESMGDVIGDLSSRRGKVLGSDSLAGITEIKAHVPMSEVLRYAPDLRSMTGGQGFFTMEFAYYEEAPQPVAEKVIAEYRKSRSVE